MHEMKIIVITLCCLLVVWSPIRPVAVEFEPDSLSLKTRLQVFEKVWTTINEGYYDPNFNGVNWSEVHERYRPRVEGTKSDEEFLCNHQADALGIA
ncbi:MAG: hypothetical protein DMF72_18340 [Acidobacteria bacterium]|nr:MAG: hypothetical protein DMF72_18340 [Acidobacteriota bacterium]